jgi:hypothetical protein
MDVVFFYYDDREGLILYQYKKRRAESTIDKERKRRVFPDILLPSGKCP